jgi:hypothetical protein
LALVILNKKGYNMAKWIDSVSPEIKESAKKFIEELESGQFHKAYLPNTGEEFNAEVSAKSFESFLEANKDILITTPNFDNRDR